MGKAHPTGATRTDEYTVQLTLEWTMRHIYFKQTTHLYNMQRLKRAQGLSMVVEVLTAIFFDHDVKKDRWAK